MRFNLTLSFNRNSSGVAILPINYQYGLSSAIFNIISHANGEFGAFFHYKGYMSKRFKLFTFSDLHCDFRISGDRMILTGSKAFVTICFHAPTASENFIKGLFMNQGLYISDLESRVDFMIEKVEAQASDLGDDDFLDVLLQPLSPLVVGTKKFKGVGHYDYRSPVDEDFTEHLLFEWIEKYVSVHKPLPGIVGLLKRAVKINVKQFPNPFQQRLITFKLDRNCELKVRGYTKFLLHVQAPKDMIELGLNAGIGLHNSQGMGCIKIFEQ